MTLIDTTKKNNKEPEGVKFIVQPSRRKSVKKAKVFIEGKLGIDNTLSITKW